MKLAIYTLALLVSLAGMGRAQVCLPECASQPSKCCAQPEADTFLMEECTSASSKATELHFVLVNETGAIQFGLVEESGPATFSVSGETHTTTLGNSGPFTFTVGTSLGTARFQVVDAIHPLHVVGQCVGTRGNAYSIPFPAFLVVQGRALLVSGRNPFYCKTGVGPDLLCLQVKGQVSGPFQAGELCDPDRVEYACGLVS